ncbi:hypothetical protein IFO69_16920 [Echinicola sp. CAU 1574]|uniref:Class I SAM-dependent methyltransferase n=1 Tax=Echinicola arenosa TaxID=2774144 RepID=A0ABR9ANS2_9BACT|nr:hypothetical protein [Echinicola arenosa]MBD8490436.1 hypothetical protein [Echinicola arenosa]
MIKKIRDKLFGINKLGYLIAAEGKRNRELSSYNMRELKAIELLKSYFPEGFLFETGFSISFQTIQHIINDLIIYKPKVILEFGSGLSTQILSNYINKHQLDIKIISIDDNQEWQNALMQVCKGVDFHTFPLKDEHPYSYGGKGKWFDIPVNHPINSLEFDLVIVDAPKGGLGKQSRVGFVPFVKDKLSNAPIIYLDDTHRQDEKEIGQFLMKTIPAFVGKTIGFNYTRYSFVDKLHTSPS